MSFHLEFDDHRGSNNRQSILGKNLDEAEQYASGVIANHTERDEPMTSVMIYEAEQTAIGFGLGKLRSTWDGTTWDRVGTD